MSLSAAEKAKRSAGAGEITLDEVQALVEYKRAFREVERLHLKGRVLMSAVRLCDHNLQLHHARKALRDARFALFQVLECPEVA